MQYPTLFETDEVFARQLDAADSLLRFRDQFHIPRHGDEPVIYLCSHSLGLQPKSARACVDEELAAWADFGADGHFRGDVPWYTIQERLRDPLARLVGAMPSEVVAMNGLTVNLHLMLATFYRPVEWRHKILIDEPAFPSDLYAVKSVLKLHGFDPQTALLTVKARPGEHTVRQEDIEANLDERGKEISLVLWNGVNFLTGQCFDIRRIVAAAKRHGCVVGFDLAHAAGNVELNLHEWQADFAVWCHYKYLCGGPGAVGGCFVHEKHGENLNLPRLAGWWGNDPATRFRLQLEPEFIPQPGAGGWQVSNPPILALATVRAALALYDEIGMAAFRQRSEALTAYLLFLLDQLPPGQFEIVTPRRPAERGCMISMLARERSNELFAALKEANVIGDFREPNVIRVAPHPLINTFHELWRFVQILNQGV